MRRNVLMAFAATALLGGCSSSQGPDPSALSTLKVVTATTGSNLDADGYQLRGTLLTSRHLGINDSTVYDSVQFGDRSFTLDSVAGNCVVAGGATQTRFIPAGTSRQVFDITCS